MSAPSSPGSSASSCAGFRGGRLEVLQLPAEAAGLRPGLEQGPVGVGAAHVQERADPCRGHADHRGGEREDGFVGDHRDDPDRDRQDREHRARGDAPVAVGPEVVVGSVSCLAHVVPASSARSAMISVSRKSFGV